MPGELRLAGSGAVWLGKAWQSWPVVVGMSSQGQAGQGSIGVVGCGIQERLGIVRKAGPGQARLVSLGQARRGQVGLGLDRRGSQGVDWTGEAVRGLASPVRVRQSWRYGRRGLAVHVVARQGAAERGRQSRRCLVRLEQAWQSWRGKAVLGQAVRDPARQPSRGMASRDMDGAARQSRHCVPREGAEWRDMAVTARPGKDRRGQSRQPRHGTEWTGGGGVATWGGPRHGLPRQVSQGAASQGAACSVLVWQSWHRGACPGWARRALAGSGASRQSLQVLARLGSDGHGKTWQSVQGGVGQGAVTHG